MAALQPDLLDAKCIEDPANLVGIWQPVALKRMIKARHVQTTTLKNPITAADQIYFTAAGRTLRGARMSWKGLGLVIRCAWR
ncbi:hypothetical protein [Salipiger aestuarii]|uniref:hypothetical protein n=1 Tax=Salipiger aestuarii TaxID=568098 RepID=UPI0012390A58|nr:hypothetical protein [Salipiger aestuarii]KAA8606036.1 hypothetical protein AL037_20850 [Salipiger aestuarii]